MNKTLNFWLMPNADFDTKQIIDRELKYFHKIYPSITVKTEVIPWLHAWPRIVQACKEKSNLDIIMLGTTWVQTLAHLGALKNLDSYKFNKNIFLPAYIDMCVYQKNLWAIPWFCEGKVLFYRKDHAEKAGVDISTISTWDKFYAACKKLSAVKKSGCGIPPLGFSTQNDQVLAQNVAGLVWCYGSDFISNDGKYSLLSDNKFKEGLKILLKFISSDFIQRTHLNQLSTGDVITDFFCKDAYSFVISSPWPLRIFLNPDVPSYIGDKQAKKIGMTLVPGGPAGRFNFAGGSTLAVTGFTQHPHEAGLLLKFLSSEQSQKRYCKAINMLPGRRDVDVHFPLVGEGQEVYKDAIKKYGRSFPPHPLWGSIECIIRSGLSDALSNYCRTCDAKMFFKNIDELGSEIDHILYLFGE